MERGQISIEYLIIVGFIVLIVIGMVGVAFLYVSNASDQIKSSQLERFADKVISSSESVFFAGEPSKVTVTAYLPAGVQSIQVVGQELVFNISTNSGENIIAFSSEVPITITIPISTGEGAKRIEITAQSGGVSIVGE